eukprot:TRINITY_DN21859_c0_g1_i1.p2 TRINITY_DN21859_c0_g1~~TRINITY_DN21859_c0_g1_i1.p2  ORF type:complete len:110 (-),score=28.36 TRINITY_DN21859_c0_g1_i1:589-918(-)
MFKVIVSLYGVSDFFFLRIRRPPRSTHCISSAASDVYKRQRKQIGQIVYRNTILEGLIECQVGSYDQNIVILQQGEKNRFNYSKISERGENLKQIKQNQKNQNKLIKLQ